ncbi:MAG TPA: 50S ribosomal protein L10 [Nautiliaceae bacterium]|nr:50S ribosomal protein L10 [Nautiliaceae bacterium]
MVQEWKKKEVEYLKSLIKDHNVIGIVDIFKLPALPFQRMRKELRNSVKIKVSKKNLIKKAIDQLKDEKKGLEKLEEYLEKAVEPALLVTNDNPFRLYKILEKNKSPAPAEAGAIAPKDIIVPAGPTDFPPMQIPMFKKAGIKTKVSGGKIEVVEDTVVTKAGEKIRPEVADLLNKLGIEPLEIGLDLVAAYESGIVYDKSILAIDEKEYINNLEISHLGAINLATEIAYLTKETIEPIFRKSFLGAKQLAKEIGYISKETLEDFIIQAVSEANALDNTINPKEEQTKKEEGTEEKKEEKKEEEKTDIAGGLAALFG